jgi:hypothetical protein
VSGSRLQRNDPSGGFGATDTLRGGRGTGEEWARGTASEYRGPEARKERGPQDDNRGGIAWTSIDIVDRLTGLAPGSE